MHEAPWELRRISYNHPTITHHPILQSYWTLTKQTLSPPPPPVQCCKQRRNNFWLYTMTPAQHWVGGAGALESRATWFNIEFIIKTCEFCVGGKIAWTSFVQDCRYWPVKRAKTHQLSLKFETAQIWWELMVYERWWWKASERSNWDFTLCTLIKNLAILQQQHWLNYSGWKYPM